MLLVCVIILFCLSEYCDAASKDPYFSSFPKDVTTVQGSSVTLPCEVSPNKGFEYYWELNGSKIANTTRRFQHGSKLHITRADRERDTGQFRCIAKSVDKQVRDIVSSPASINVLWIGDVSVKLQEPSSPSLIKPGIDVTLRCHVDASDETLVDWFRNTNQVLRSHKFSIKKNKLHIKTVQLTDNGVYRCTAKNAAGIGESSQNFPLIIKTDNVVTINVVPSDLLIKKHNRALFNCAYRNADKIDWYFQNISLVNNYKYNILSNGSLEIYNVTEENEGYYTCRGVSSISRDTYQEYSAKLSLAYLESFTTSSFEPELKDNYQIAAGINTIFQLTCLRPKSKPPAKYWWDSPKGLTVSDEGRIRVGEDRMLIIENVTHEDGGKYKCVASNIAGTVEQDVEVVITDKPRIISHPQSITVDQGNVSVLTCNFETDFPQFTNVWWRKNNEPIKDIKIDKEDKQRVKIFKHNGTLFIHSTQPSDRGEYTCEVITDGYGPVLSNAATISVIEQLKFYPLPVNKNIELSSTTKIHCKAQGTPPPIVRWHKGQLSAPVDFPNHIIDMNGTLQFNGVQSDDKGFYTCIASNSQGSINATIKIEIVVAPKFLVEPRNPTEVNEGEAISVDCLVEGDPKPKIEWDKNFQMNNFNLTRFEILSNGTLFIKNVQKDDEGIYGCIAGNSAGLIRKEFRLIVRRIGEMYVDDDNAVTKAVLITMAVASAYIILVVGLTVWCRFKRRSRSSYSEALKNDEGNTDHLELKDTATGSDTTKTTMNHVNEDAESSKKSEEQTISKDDLKEMKLIGRGEFGDVMVAKIAKSIVRRNAQNGQINIAEDKEVPVMAKALNQTKDENCLIEFKREIDMFSQLSHENVSKFYGICKEPDLHYIILEHTDWGDLKKFLLATKNENAVALTTVQSITILHQISRGMEHLADKRFTHKDLAARNCLISSTLFVKVSLPRLTRDPYSQEYCKHLDQVIPLRWLPYEAVYEDDYSTKTDTYSFGVLIWEIFSKGELPQSKINDSNFLIKLKEKSLEWKAHPSTPEELVKLQESCLDSDMSKRPLFSAVSKEIGNILKSL